MGISTPFIRRPIATSLLMAGVLMIGAVAYPLLPVAPLPQVDFPTIQVTAQLPGADPVTMASSVTAPLERQFAQIPGVTQMTSSSTLGNSAITVQFDLNRNIDGAAQDIQTAINAAGGQLPKTLPSPPTYRKVNPADAPILVLALHSDALPITVVDDYAENILVQNISQIPGVAQVSVNGQQKPAVRIQVDPEKLASMGLGLEDVRAVIANATTDSPKGSIDGATRTFTIYDNDQLLSAEPWNDVILTYRNGAPVRIRDIGRAVDGAENNKNRGLGQRQARHSAGGPQAAGRQRHRDGGSHQGAAAATAGGHPDRRQSRCAQRSDDDHPRVRRRRSVHVDPDRRAGGVCHLYLSAQLLGNRDSECDGPVGADRVVRPHVSARATASITCR